MVKQKKLQWVYFGNDGVEYNTVKVQYYLSSLQLKVIIWRNYHNLIKLLSTVPS